MSREQSPSRTATATGGGNNTLGVQIPSPRKKSNRRATAVYPAVNSSNKTSKPFSRSAAKRGSVMALGSIEHLQYYFTKAGLSAKEKPQSSSILVPAVGGPQYIRTSPSGEVQPILDDEHFVLPPTPIQPKASSQQPLFVSTGRDYVTDPEALKRAAVLDLKAVQDAWNLSPPSSPLPSPTETNSNPNFKLDSARWNEQVDVLSLLRSTTRAIRSIRNYVVSLPDDPTSLQVLFSRPIPKPEYRPSTLQPTLTKRPAYHARKFSQDVLYQIRQSALEVLAGLHALEEKTRLPLEDEAYDVQSDHGSNSSHSMSLATGTTGTSATSRGQSMSSPEDDMMTESDASFSFSVVKVPGREEHIHVWTNEDDEALLEDPTVEGRHGPGWDEKLVLGAGWLYRQDLTLGDVRGERERVGRYLDAVDGVLFGGPVEGGGPKRGWETVKLRVDSGRRRSSGGGESPRSTEGGILLGGTNGRRGGLIHSLEGMRLTDDPDSPRGVASPGGILHDLHEEEEEEEDEDEDREIPDGDLPDWARRSPSNKALTLDPLARAHALLVHLLPATLLHLVPLPTDSDSDSDSDSEEKADIGSPITPTQRRLEQLGRLGTNGTSGKGKGVDKLDSRIPRLPFLQALSSGQLLCVAYNAALRRSRRPWGFINLENVHDVVGMESQMGIGAGMHIVMGSGSGNGSARSSGRNSLGGEDRRESTGDDGGEGAGGSGSGRKVGWTFRRTDNLRLWTAALRLRYQIPLSCSPLINKSSSDPPFILFDAKTVARREDGWDTMLEGVVMRWVEEVVRDKRRGK